MKDRKIVRKAKKQVRKIGKPKTNLLRRMKARSASCPRCGLKDLCPYCKSR